jgi:hypothetical protein
MPSSIRCMSGLTTSTANQPIEAPMLRIQVEPSPENGPLNPSAQPHSLNITWEITTQAFLSPNMS